LYALTEEETRTIVSSYNFLFELALEHDLELRQEELAIYDKLNGHLEVLENQRAIGGVPKNAAPTSLVTARQLELARRDLPEPPPSRFEEDEYEPNIPN
jgi:hypothetical protein